MVRSEASRERQGMVRVDYWMRGQVSLSLWYQVTDVLNSNSQNSHDSWDKIEGL